MKLALSPQDAAFRDEVHAYIAENYPAQMRVSNPETDLTKKQMLQHGMADMFIAHQEALCLMQHLNLSLSAGEAGISRLASGAKSKIGYAGKFVVDQAVQLYGGMGMTTNRMSATTSSGFPPSTSSSATPPTTCCTTRSSTRPPEAKR
jgi:hypothetical protein